MEFFGGIFVVVICLASSASFSQGIFVLDGCMLNQVEYEVGDTIHTGDPCESCVCERDGRVKCDITVACDTPTCVDPVYDPEYCCPRCPHGSNCNIDGVTEDAGATIRETDRESGCTIETRCINNQRYTQWFDCRNENYQIFTE